MRDNDKPIPNKWSVITLCIFLLLLMGFCVQAGMSVWAFIDFIGYIY